MPYYAHTGVCKDKSDWQLLQDHLKSVAKLAVEKAEKSFPETPIVIQQAFVSAMLHDLGKYRPGFQKYLAGEILDRQTTYHKQAGALLAAKHKHLLSSFVIAGHHGGIPDSHDLQSKLQDSPAKDGLEESLSAVETEIKDWLDNFPSAPLVEDKALAEILIRIIFSILVDADGEDTAKHEASVHGWQHREPAQKLCPAIDLAVLLQNIEALSQKAKNGPTKSARETVLLSALQAADMAPGIFSLRVPTGGGKTLSGLAFALKHAVKYQKERIIYVAPYLTILEQTASVIRSALNKHDDWSYVLEHHSLADIDRDAEEISIRGPRGERWDSPIVVTSNVQLWESLFSNKPGKCRKVHNLARSVILLDECQSIPPSLFSPVCSMIQSLVEHFQSTVVLCTATQPSWNKRIGFEEGLKGVREIVPLELGIFDQLKRTTIDWPAREEQLSWEEIADLVNKHQQALVMLNTRKAACSVFKLLSAANPEHTFHLSTGLCPEHRKQILNKVLANLTNGKPCLLVATQVLEAGVDIDFPVVFRELAPLEAVLQAAGRCNREGKLNSPNGAPGGKVKVFRSKDGKLPPDEWYRAGISVVEALFLAAGRNPQPDDPVLVEDYFKTLHAQGDLDKYSIQAMRKNLNFEEVAEAFKLIRDGGCPVVVASWGDGKEKADKLLSLAKSARPGDSRRRLSAFQVNIRSYEMQNHQNWITEEAPGLFVYRGPYDMHLGMLADPVSDQLLLV